MKLVQAPLILDIVLSTFLSLSCHLSLQTIAIVYYICHLPSAGKPNLLWSLRIVYVIDHFTVACLVTWPLYGSEAGGDLVLIQTLLLLLCKSSCSYAN